MMTELPSIAKAAADMAEGSLRPLDLVEHCLARIAALDGELKAWVHVDAAGARKQAERLGELAEQGDILGPLHGIPVGVKDIIDVAGMPTRCGSPLRSGEAAKQDAAVVRALRKSGAIVLGKTVTTEWACFDPSPTRNPWNRGHTPGGSSSGSAAAVCVDMCLGALGTQTGGSIIRPASFCGVCGLKPGYGELPMEGIAPLAMHLDHAGPMARRVSDLYLLWQALASDAHGSMESMFSRKWADSDLESWVDAYGLNQTLFVLEGPLLDRMASAMKTHFQATLGRLRSAVHLKPLELPAAFQNVPAWHRCINVAEAAAHHRAWFPAHRDQYGPCIASLLDEGRQLPAIDYAEALIQRDAVRDELARLMHAHEDVLGCLVMPSTLGPAPTRETTGDPVFNSPWSYIGWPSLTIPSGLVDGLPVGLQFIATTVPQVFAMAGLCERLLGFHERPNLLENGS